MPVKLSSPIRTRAFATILTLLLARTVEAVTRSQFERTIDVFEREFARDAAELGRVFDIQHDWQIEWAQAFARRWETDHLVVYGGVARMERATVDSLALVLCHEVGHLYGGTPFSDDHNRLALEGQADWWATAECWPRIITQLPLSATTDKARAVDAALVVTAHYARNLNVPAPTLATPDPTVVGTTNRTHPHPQCRLDTYVAGIEGRGRPRCWWAP